MNLYEINAEIMACVDEETGEIIDTVKLDQLQMVFGEKVEGIALYIKNLAAEAAAIKAEKDKLGERQRICENKVASLKNYLQANLCGEKFKTARVLISYRKSESVVVDDLSKVDKSYLKYSDPVADRTAIKKQSRQVQLLKEHICSRIRTSRLDKGGCEVMNSEKIVIPARKQQVNEQGVIKLTPEALNALTEVVNETNLSIRQVASTIILQAIEKNLIEFRREEN